jgi:acetyl esterase/lipase
MILLYPVISMQDSVTHHGSQKNLLGPNPDKELVSLLSNELQVTNQTPPTFIAHASDDSDVNVINSILFYTALIKAGVPAEMHLYEKGGHGFGMQPDRGIAAANWPIRCADWLRQRNLLTPKIGRK